MAYIGKSPTGTGVRQRYYFTATGGETSLSGADDNGLTLSYSDGAYVDVLLNGIELVAGTDYNTSTANTIAGLSALAASDIVTVTVYDIFTVADTVSAKDGGTFSSNVTFNGNINAGTIKEATGTNTGLTVDSSGIVDMPNTTMIDVFRLHTDHTSTGIITSWERPDDGIQSGAKIGSTMTESSGVFTFPRTGIYKISFFATITNASGDDTTAFELYGTSDNSTYARLTRLQEGNTSSTNTIGSVFGFTIVDITDTSTHKVRFYADSVSSGSAIQGNQDRNHTAVMFEFMGNT